MRQLGKVGEVCTVDENVGEVSLRGFTPHYIVGPNRGAPPPPLLLATKHNVNPEHGSFLYQRKKEKRMEQMTNK